MVSCVNCSIWTNTIGHDPYAAENENTEDAKAKEEQAAGLLLLAKMSNLGGGSSRGACGKCGMAGHLTFQCRNIVSKVESESSSEEDSSDEDDDDDIEKGDVKGLSVGQREKVEMDSKREDDRKRDKKRSHSSGKKEHKEKKSKHDKKEKSSKKHKKERKEHKRSKDDHHKKKKRRREEENK